MGFKLVAQNANSNGLRVGKFSWQKIENNLMPLCDRRIGYIRVRSKQTKIFEPDKANRIHTLEVKWRKACALLYDHRVLLD